MEPAPRILTNMAFWQSPRWVQATESIYQMPASADPLPMPWWREAWTLWRRMRSADIVVTMGARESLLYGWLCLLSGRPSRQILCEVFFDEADARSLAWRLKTWAYRTIARRAIGVLTNSSAEVPVTRDRLNLPPDRVRYVPMHTNIANPAVSERDEGFILAAGRSLRDYPTLLAAAPSISRPIRILCGKNDLAGAVLPPNVTLLREASRDRYLDELARCAFAVVPLLPAARATGQVVALEAMSLGKAVIATRVSGVLDILNDGVTGLLVPPRDPVALAEACGKLADDDNLRGRLSNAALRDVLDRFTIDRHAETKLSVIREMWKLHAQPDS